MIRIRAYEARVLEAIKEMGGLERPIHATGEVSDDSRALRKKLDNCSRELVRKAVTELKANGLLKKVGVGKFIVVPAEYETLDKMGKDISPEEVLKLREEGLSWDKIARRLKAARHRVRSLVDPEFAEKWERERAQLKILDSLGITPKPKVERPILVDTRDLTGILMGDPIPNDPRRKIFQDLSATEV